MTHARRRGEPITLRQAGDELSPCRLNRLATLEEKLAIAREHLLEKQVRNHGLTPEQFTITEPGVDGVGWVDVVLEGSKTTTLGAIEGSQYDAIYVAVTAFARSIQHQDKRVEVEREAGAILKLAA